MNDFPLPKQRQLRSDAAWVLYQILENGKSSRDCLTKVQNRHTQQDNAWLQEMTMGALRKLPQLQIWLRGLLDNPLKGNKKILEHLMLVGFYQLAYTRVSHHAAVSETVEAAEVLGGRNLKNLINAILRNFIRLEIATQESDDPIIQSGFPKWFYKKLTAAYGDNGSDILAQSNTVAPIWLRINTLKTTMKDFTQALTKANVQYTLSDEHADGVLLQSRHDVTKLPGFAQGWFAVQDGAAQLAATYLDPQAGDYILDCCAAPGGKTGHIIERQPQIKSVTALDNDKYRLKRVSENMQRLGHAPMIVQGDASQPSQWWDNTQFDRILLDAPCSATGVIRRHPDIRWLRKSTDIANLVKLQADILRSLWPLLKSGGTLVYATCSILPEENAQQISQFLADTPDAVLAPLTDNESAAQPGRQILPGEQQMDGFYYARLIKS